MILNDRHILMNGGALTCQRISTKYYLYCECIRRLHLFFEFELI